MVRNDAAGRFFSSSCTFSLKDARPFDLKVCVIVSPLTVSAKQLTNRIYREECEADFTDNKYLPFQNENTA